MPTTKTDEQIKKEIVDQIYRDRRIDASGVMVDVNNGHVSLFGTVSDYRAGKIAVANASIVEGVREIDNRLTVVPDEPLLNDKALKDLIDTALENLAGFDTTKAFTRVESGIVTISGSVDSLWAKGFLEERITDLEGIVDIRNDLAVVPNENIIDETLAKNALESLARAGLEGESGISIRVENGIVTLMGTASGWVARQKAYQAVGSVYGVTEVRDRLRLT
jgi:osmotically-inducible protein OsmY